MTARQHRRGRHRGQHDSLVAVRTGGIETLPAVLEECGCPRAIVLRDDLVVVETFHAGACWRLHQLKAGRA